MHRRLEWLSGVYLLCLSYASYAAPESAPATWDLNKCLFYENMADDTIYQVRISGCTTKAYLGTRKTTLFVDFIPEGKNSGAFTITSKHIYNLLLEYVKKLAPDLPITASSPRLSEILRNLKDSGIHIITFQSYESNRHLEGSSNDLKKFKYSMTHSLLEDGSRYLSEYWDAADYPSIVISNAPVSIDSHMTDIIKSKRPCTLL